MWNKNVFDSISFLFCTKTKQKKTNAIFHFIIEEYRKTNTKSKVTFSKSQKLHSKTHIYFWTWLFFHFTNCFFFYFFFLFPSFFFFACFSFVIAFALFCFSHWISNAGNIQTHICFAKITRKSRHKRNEMKRRCW